MAGAGVVVGVVLFPLQFFDDVFVGADHLFEAG
jgi:hypothetical protein